MESISQFASRIKSKYPDYASIPDADLVSRIIDKHPEYKEVVDLSHPDNGPGAGGMGDVKMAESAAGTPPLPYKDPNFSGGFGQPNTKAAAMIPRFLGDVAQSASTGLANSAIQGVQDNWGSPLGMVGGVIKEEAKNLASPFYTFEKPIQSSSESLQRMGIPNTPQPFPTRYPGEVAPGGNAPIPGLADQAGLVADLMAPALGVPGAGKVGSEAGQLAEKAGESIGGKAEQLANRIQTNILRPRVGDYNTGLDVANLKKYGIQGDVADVANGARDQIRTASGNLRDLIKQGKDEGAQVDLVSAIQAAEKKVLQSDKTKYATLKPSFQQLKDFAKNVSNIGPDGLPISEDGGNGLVNLLDAQHFKSEMGDRGAWEYIAGKKGATISQDDSKMSQAASHVYGQLKDAIVAAAPDGVAAQNKILSDLIPIERAASYRKMVAERNNVFSPTDLAGSLSAIMGGPKGLAWWAAIRASKSGTTVKVLQSLADKLRTAKTPEEVSTIGAALQKAGAPIDGDLQAKLAEMKRPFLQSLEQPAEGALPPRTPMGRPALDKPPTLVPGQPVPRAFGPTAPPSAPAPDPMADLYPTNRNPALEAPQGAPGVEGMMSPEDAAGQPADIRASWEAAIRQARPVRVPPIPEAPGGVQVIDPQDLPLSPRAPKGNIQPNGFPPLRESPQIQDVLNKYEANRRPLVVNQSKIDALKELLKQDLPKAKKQEILKLIREENLKIPLSPLGE